MRNKLIVFVTLLIGALGLFSCEEDGTRVEIIKDVAANELQPLSESSYVLTQDAEGEEFETFEWAAPDFGFAAAETFVLQVDISENDFAAPVDLISTSQNSATISVGDMNKALLNLGVTPGVPVNIEFRVKTTISPEVETVFSTVEGAAITAYTTSFPPIYAVGDALQGWGTFVRMHSTAPSVYETIVYFNNGKKFRYLANANDWTGTNYRWSDFVTVDSDLSSAGDTDGNILFTGTSGWYKMITDLNGKTITLDPASEPKLYLVGDGQAWSFNNAVDMTFTNDGIFKATVSFVKGHKFRFFTAKDWGAGIGSPYFEDGEIDDYLTPANDNDGNFIVAGESGTFVITVDMYEYTIVVEPPPAPPEQIYAIGDLNGWSTSSPVVLNSIDYYKFEGNVTITTGNTFRLFLEPDWGAIQYGYGDFTTVDSKLEAVGDSDDNFRFIGTTGTFKLTADLHNKTIVLTPL